MSWVTFKKIFDIIHLFLSNSHSDLKDMSTFGLCFRIDVTDDIRVWMNLSVLSTKILFNSRVYIKATPGKRWCLGDLIFLVFHVRLWKISNFRRLRICRWTSIHCWCLVYLIGWFNNLVQHWSGYFWFLQSLSQHRWFHTCKPTLTQCWGLLDLIPWFKTVTNVWLSLICGCEVYSHFVSIVTICFTVKLELI